VFNASIMSSTSMAPSCLPKQIKSVAMVLHLHERDKLPRTTLIRHLSFDPCTKTRGKPNRTIYFPGSKDYDYHVSAYHFVCFFHLKTCRDTFLGHKTL
jgi:hypothetical protein